tara:strand:- start:48 stop:341 length:294 start_codon:yes stop_codon:yes gene_type:complete
LEEEPRISSEATIHISDCLYALQQAVFLPLAGDHIIKIVQLPYKYADNSIAVTVWKQVLDKLISKDKIISYTFIPESKPEQILVEFPPSSSSSTSNG